MEKEKIQKNSAVSLLQTEKDSKGIYSWKSHVDNRYEFEAFMRSLNDEQQIGLFNDDEFMKTLLDKKNQNNWADALSVVNKNTVLSLFNDKLLSQLIEDEKLLDRKFDYAKDWIKDNDCFDILFENPDTQIVFKYSKVLLYISKLLNSENQLKLLENGLIDEEYQEVSKLIFSVIGNADNLSKLCKNIDYKIELFNNSKIMRALNEEALTFMYENKKWGSLTSEQKHVIAKNATWKPIKFPKNFLQNPDFYDALVQDLSTIEFFCLTNNFTQNNSYYGNLINARNKYLRQSLDKMEQSDRINKSNGDGIFELFFGDTEKNSILMIKMILDSCNSFEEVKSAVGKENLEVFKKIVGRTKSDLEFNYSELYKMLKSINKDFSEVLYDGFAKARECFEKDVNAHLLRFKPGDELKGQNFSALISCQRFCSASYIGDRIDLNDKKQVSYFVAKTLDRVLSEFSDNNHNAISCSIIDQNHITTFVEKEEKPVIFGYDRIVEGSLMHASRCDSFSNLYNDCDDDNNLMIGIPVSFSTPDYVEYNEFMRRTGICYNEIKLKQMSNGVFNGRNVLKPSYILVFDEVLPIHEEFAKQLGIPIKVLFSENYIDKQQISWNGYKTEEDEFETYIHLGE